MQLPVFFVQFDSSELAKLSVRFDLLAASSNPRLNLHGNFNTKEKERSVKKTLYSEVILCAEKREFYGVTHDLRLL